MERLTGLDAGFLYMETPTLHMHTLKIAVIDPANVPGGYRFDLVKEVLGSRLHRLPPFRLGTLRRSRALAGRRHRPSARPAVAHVRRPVPARAAAPLRRGVAAATVQRPRRVLQPGPDPPPHVRLLVPLTRRREGHEER